MEYLCSRCNQCYSKIELLLVHLETMHSLKKKDKYVCHQDTCYQIFYNQYRFKRHLNTIHQK